MNIYLLIDYDNIERPISRFGPTHVVEHILERFLCQVTDFSIARAHARLYGGWYQRENPTHSAQKLAEELLRSFPRNVRAGEGTYVRSSAELAYSLLSRPNRHLLNTYRPRPMPNNLRCESPSARGCETSPCPLSLLPEFLSRGHCPVLHCKIRPGDILSRPEQKLVDVMMATDLNYLASTEDVVPVIVTSDEDLWPSIQQACDSRSVVFHMHGKARRSTPAYYSAGVGTSYRELSI